MSRRKQVGSGVDVPSNALDLEGDSLVPTCHQRGPGGRLLCAYDRRHVADLPASLFPLGHPATKAVKCGAESPLDVMRLQTAGSCLVHLPSHQLDIGVGEVLLRQRTLLHQLPASSATCSRFHLKMSN